jgi:D-arabinose 1-dehydrogenase-like Zn-dependent alcohol dehydrogenase
MAGPILSAGRTSVSAGDEARLPERAVNVLGRPGAGSFGLTLWSALMTTRRVAGIAGSRS